jgi:LCP family protein required for cell wall assembly
MNRSMLGIMLGVLVGFFAVTAAFAGLSIARPGWLRTLFSRSQVVPTLIATESPLPTEPGRPGVFSTATPSGPIIGATPSPTHITIPETGPCGGPEQLTIAILGVDDRENNYAKPTRTDAISIVTVRLAQKSASVLSIPRDLYVPLPNLERVNIQQDRINTAYLYGEVYGVEGGGPAEVKQTIELNFGIRVHRYLMLNFGAFVSFVDALGGIEVDVPKAIYDPQFPAEDGSGTVIFELPAGRQHLDGQTALRYARTRHQDDDYHRVARQQQVMLAIRDKLISPEVIPHIPALISSLSGLVKTDLTAEEITALACVGPQIDRAAIGMHAIDGTMVLAWTTPTGGRVSIPNRDVIAPMVEEFLNGR